MNDAGEIFNNSDVMQIMVGIKAKASMVKFIF
jgi:hypothetical protein